MTARTVTIRNGVNTAIEAGSYVESIEVEKTYFPQEKLEDITTAQVKILCYGPDTVRETRARDKGYEIPVQVALQKKVDPTDTDSIDQLMELLEQVMEVCESDSLVSGYTWLRTEQLKDDNGLPFQFRTLKTGHVFEAYFSPIYKTFKEAT